jgi:hypothetical protein
MTDFHNAVGQYAGYRSLIQATEPTYQLYLAIDDITYENFFTCEGIAFIVRSSQIFLLVVDIDQQEIVKWIS